MDDAGILAQVGYTAGSRRAPQIVWAMNLRDGVDRASHAYKISCVFAHIWSEARKTLPDFVIDDFEKVCDDLDGLKMDAGTLGKGQDILRYEIEGVEYETSSFAPPGCFCARNYMRYANSALFS